MFTNYRKQTWEDMKFDDIIDMTNPVYTNTFLNEKRLVGDALVDPVVKRTLDDGPEKLVFYRWLQGLSDNRSMVDVKAPTGFESIVDAVRNLPPWADRKGMASGCAFFAKYSADIMNLLGLLALPYCYTAAYGAKVLYLSDRMRTDTARRLVETGTFVWEVMDPDGFTDRGKARASILKVRLMHAVARHYTRKSNQWDSAWGYPVNQEDMAGTNLSFSIIVIRGLRKLGCTISSTEQQDFMHLWNVIGWQLGLHEALLPTSGKAAFDLEEAIRIRQFTPSPHGQELTASLVAYISRINPGKPFSSKEIVQLMRYLMGEQISDMLGLEKGTLAESKISLLKTASFFKDLKFSRDHRKEFYEGHREFLKMKAATL